MVNFFRRDAMPVLEPDISTSPVGLEPLVSGPANDSIWLEYEKFYKSRALAVQELEKRVKKAVAPFSSGLRVTGRVKSFKSFKRKYIRMLQNSKDTASPQITDLIGIRIICTFLEDLDEVENSIRKEFKTIEVERKGREHTFREFGYESIHLLIEIPDDIAKEGGGKTAEIQIRTILQDAWAEVEHELIYKPEFYPVDAPMKRKLAAVNASLSLADTIFQEIRAHQRRLNGELGKRRRSFFRKIEESTDDILLSGVRALPEKQFVPEENGEEIRQYPSESSIDDLLLAALTAHNEERFSEAIAVYTRILELKTIDAAVRSIILNHRGMAFFARSNYEEAAADFAEALELNPSAYKAVYYEGIVYSVLQRYSQALDAFNRSLEINPYQPYCLFRRAQTYFHLEDYPKALADCEKALSQEPIEAIGKLKELVLDKLKM
jgi:putative GTP pyrophosphokinase